MRVLLGVGGSDDSLDALERTVERTAVAGDELTIAVVNNPASAMDAEKIKTVVHDTLASASTDAAVRHVTGDAGSRLVEIAETEEYDMIVLGGGQSSPMGKISLGSISEFVLLNAAVSVKLVR